MVIGLRSWEQLHGFEKDINRLIDAYALQANLEQCLSFHTFRRLFHIGGYAYLHQAYPGCEHSPEYTQLLYATALDRLDVLSPTAAPSSPLWLMHVDPSDVPASLRLAAAGTAAVGGGRAGAAAATAVTPRAAPVQQHCNISHVPSQSSFGINNSPFIDAESIPSAQIKQPQAGAAHTQQQQQQHPSLANLPPDQQQYEQLHQIMQQQQQQQPEPNLQQQGQQGLCCMQPLQSPDLPDLGLLQSPVWDSSAQRLAAQGFPSQQQQQQQLRPGNVGQLQSTTLQQQALHPQAVQQQQQQPPCQLPQHVQQTGLEHKWGPAGSPVLQLPQPAFGQPELPALAMPPVTAFDDDDFDDDFLNDLVKIFDEAEEEEGLAGLLPSQVAGASDFLASHSALTGMSPLAGSAATAGDGLIGASAPTTAAAVAPVASSGLMQPPAAARPSPPGPPPTTVPLAVKAAVLYMLYCLHETQLTLPKVCIYVPLQQLQLLNAAAAEFRAAGPAAVDALLILQQLIGMQHLLVGQFRRPRQWQPQLPDWLKPPKAAIDLGIGSAAANRAAARAHGADRVAAVLAVANAARSLQQQRSNGRSSSVDPQVHREAMFHIKTALRSLSNFKSLQTLCSDYANARRAIFEPLLSIKEPAALVQPPVAASEANKQAQQQQQQQQQQGAARKRGKRGRAAAAADTEQQAPARKARKLGATAAAAAATGSCSGAASIAGPDAGAAEQQQQQRQHQQQSVGPAAAAEPPELFDRNFGSALQQLAQDEATRMLVLLDPTYSHGQMQKRKQRESEQAATAAAAAAAGSSSGASLTELRSLGGPGGGPGGARSSRAKQKKQQSGSAQGTATTARQGWVHAQELHDAGILQASGLQELQGTMQGPVGLGAAQKVLQLQLQRQQRTLEVAEEWFSAHDALMMAHQDDDGDEDMPC